VQIQIKDGIIIPYIECHSNIGFVSKVVHVEDGILKVYVNMEDDVGIIITKMSRFV
jgi:hypothetical protein